MQTIFMTDSHRMAPLKKVCSKLLKILVLEKHNGIITYELFLAAILVGDGAAWFECPAISLLHGGQIFASRRSRKP
jgi:hypothetical protein